jgi:hypothetical protein
LLHGIDAGLGILLARGLPGFGAGDVADEALEL